jgi:FtsZ-binding cell division protein ZapB
MDSDDLSALVEELTQTADELVAEAGRLQDAADELMAEAERLRAYSPETQERRSLHTRLEPVTMEGPRRARPGGPHPAGQD